MRSRFQTGLAADTGNRGMSALAGTAAGPLSDGTELWPPQLKTLDRRPPPIFHFLCFWREKLKRDLESVPYRGKPGRGRRLKRMYCFFGHNLDEAPCSFCLSNDAWGFFPPLCFSETVTPGVARTAFQIITVSEAP